jgi:copper resistance protein B
VSRATVLRASAALAVVLFAVPAGARGQDAHPAHDPPVDQAPHPPGAPPPTGLPPITDEDRRAAFPDLDGQHAVHDEAVHYFVLFDQLEWQGGDGTSGVSWDTKGWVGRDVSRFWFRTEGAGEGGGLDEAEAHALYGRAVARWWDLVVGIRQDARPGPARTWAAVGVQGLAPYWFEVEATAYVGAGGRTHVRLETEYELLLTNRLVLQPLAELELYGRADPDHGIGAGLSSLEAGLRLRYEVRREFAPYVGAAWSRRFFGTADLATAAGQATSAARLVVGARVWF